MRPIRLEIDGFASFRDPVSVDFTGADLFVLSGPTGAGKSSVIDAMILALYGTVPRYDDRRLVAPAISQGRAEARVRLDFDVADHRYTAVRVIRRTKTGATTKEARLERWQDADGTETQILAGTADDVTEAVGRLLGLQFDHFTSCMVLPQGAFQAFLHARAKDRQDLLVKLLDLDMYRQVGQLARDRERDLSANGDALQRQLDGDLAEATPEALATADVRVGTVTQLLADVDAALPAIEDIRQEGVKLRQEAAAATERAALLADLRPPDDLHDLVTTLRDARAAVDSTDAAQVEAGAAVEAAVSDRESAGNATDLHRQQEAIDRLAEVTGLLGGAASTLRAAEDTAQAATDRVQQADAALEAAQQRLRHVEQQDMATALLEGHAVGDPCPVCEQPLSAIPAHDDRQHHDEAARAEAAAREEVVHARQAHTAADRALADAVSHDQRLREEHDRLTATVAERAAAGLPDSADEVRAAIDRVATLDAAVTAARETERLARAAHREARERLAAIDDRRRAAARALDDAYGAVRELGPPPIDRDDLDGSWSALTAWAAERRPALVAEAEEATRAVDAAAVRWRDEHGRLRRQVEDAGIVVTDGDRIRDEVLREVERATARRDRLRDQAERAAAVRQEITSTRRQARVADSLGQHLRSNRFEKWLLQRALTMLVRGASTTLSDLSGGAYSLTLDDTGGFAVIDHRNADEVRSARTLSGGETFLASLSLALALSEHVADLAAAGSARLDSLILDEGFGTLDAETLDTVATALEELGSRGRMIGIITHVDALAERLPVRFAVRKEAGTSTIERLAS